MINLKSGVKVCACQICSFKEEGTLFNYENLTNRFYIILYSLLYNITKTCYAFVLQVIISKNYSKDENNNSVLHNKLIVDNVKFLLDDNSGSEKNT